MISDEERYAIYILMLEDDADDRHITQTFFVERGFNVHLEFLEHTDEVLPYLEKCLNDGLPFPKIILLDKNAPASGGMKVLEQIKKHPVFFIIPVVMISGTAFPADVNESYRLGVNSFIIKPFYNDQTAKNIETFVNYWFGTVELPKVVTESAALK